MTGMHCDVAQEAHYRWRIMDENGGERDEGLEDILDDIAEYDFDLEALLLRGE